MLLNEGMLQESNIITLPIYNTELRIYSIYKWSTFWGKEPPQLGISLQACLKTMDDSLNVRLSLGMFSAAHSLSSHSVRAAWERGHLKVSQRWRVNAGIDSHLATLMYWLNSLLTVCTVWLCDMHPCSLLAWMISFIIICWLCLLQLVLDPFGFPSQTSSSLPFCFVSLLNWVSSDTA